MARPKSVVLTPAEKRAALKSAKAEVKAITAEVKAQDKALKEAQKVFDAASKTIGKTKAGAEKRLQAANDKVVALSA